MMKKNSQGIINFKRGNDRRNNKSRDIFKAQELHVLQ